MKFTKTMLGIIITATLMISCSENASDISSEDTSITSEELNSETLSTALENVIINYPVRAINDDETTEEVNSDKELKEVITKNNRPNIEFPFDITIGGEIITIENYSDLKDLLKQPKHKRPPFKLIFPVTVINADETTTEIADQDAFKTYRETLAEGVKPTFQFPISIEDKDGTVVEMANEDALNTYVTEQREEVKNNKPNNKRPPFKLVFPVTVINADETTIEIADQDAFKTYRETLAERVKPTFQFPISIEDKDGTVVEMANEDALKAYLKNTKPEGKDDRPKDRR